jgi:hypothetical protein
MTVEPVCIDCVYLAVLYLCSRRILKVTFTFSKSVRPSVLMQHLDLHCSNFHEIFYT